MTKEEFLAECKKNLLGKSISYALSQNYNVVTQDRGIQTAKVRILVKEENGMITEVIELI